MKKVFIYAAGYLLFALVVSGVLLSLSWLSTPSIADTSEETAEDSSEIHVRLITLTEEDTNTQGGMGETEEEESEGNVSSEQHSLSASLFVPQDDKANTGVKTWMDYRTITSRSSDQYQLQQDAVTDPETGIRMYEGRYMVALGTYYTQNAGEKFRITLESGFTFDAVTGDIKDDGDTDNTNQHCHGNIVEFIVDRHAIPELCRKMGDMSYLSENFTGKIAKIEKIIER